MSAVTEQLYILLYTFSYMIDDFLIFGLALYGFSKFYVSGTKIFQFIIFDWWSFNVNFRNYFIICS